MSTIKTHVKKGDKVRIIAGNHKGKEGDVLSVNAAKGLVVVEGGRQVTKGHSPLPKAMKAASSKSMPPSIFPM